MIQPLNLYRPARFGATIQFKVQTKQSLDGLDETPIQIQRTLLNQQSIVKRQLAAFKDEVDPIRIEFIARGHGQDEAHITTQSGNLYQKVKNDPNCQSGSLKEFLERVISIAKTMSQKYYQYVTPRSQKQLRHINAWLDQIDKPLVQNQFQFVEKRRSPWIEFVGDTLVSADMGAYLVGENGLIVDRTVDRTLESTEPHMIMYELKADNRWHFTLNVTMQEGQIQRVVFLDEISNLQQVVFDTQRPTALNHTAFGPVLNEKVSKTVKRLYPLLASIENNDPEAGSYVN